jgi:hypothetical protein
VQDLILTLEGTKAKVVEIGERLNEAEVSKSQMEEARGRYITAAAQGSLLFFAITSLPVICNMYETSLVTFLTVFHKALATSRKVFLPPSMSSQQSAGCSKILSVAQMLNVSFPIICFREKATFTYCRILR